MEILLLALFFISTLIFFVAGKDDFGRTESKLIIKEKETVKETGGEEKKVKEDGKEEKKVKEDGNIEPQKES